MQYKNFEIQMALEFLDSMSLSGRASLGRSAIKKVLSEKQNEYAEDQTEIVDEFDAWTDRDNGTFDASDPELKQANIDLANKDVDVSVDSPFLDDFISALENYEEDLTGANADIYASLYEDLVEGGDE